MNPSNQNDKIIDTGDIEAPKSWRKSWEVRSLLFTLRIIAVLFFLFYLSSTASMSWGWIKMKWVRHYPLESLTTLAEDHIKRGEAYKITEWVALRPKTERPVIIGMLEPLTGELDPGIFMAYALWETADKNAEKAVFWTQYARYRLRYDALRCGNESAVQDMTGILDLSPNPLVVETLNKHPDALPKALQQVLDYDAKHPAANDPTSLCARLDRINKKTSETMLPEGWAETRHILRDITEDALSTMQRSEPVKPAK